MKAENFKFLIHNPSINEISFLIEFVHQGRQIVEQRNFNISTDIAIGDGDESLIIPFDNFKREIL